jgi:TonB-dependent receptor
MTTHPNTVCRTMALAALMLAAAVTAPAQPNPKSFDIPAGDAEVTLAQFSRQADVQIIFDVDKVSGVRTAAVRGKFSPREALDRMFADTRLVAAQDEKTGALTVSSSTGAATALPRDTPARTATGSIRGRVVNRSNQEYLQKARLTIEGTNLETTTNADGSYYLPGVPAGKVHLKVFFTGLAPRAGVVEVPAGRTVVHDIELDLVESRPTAARGNDTVKLDQFVVSVSREMNASAIAINEQRFAPNLKTVVSTDEFGTVAEGHVGEFLKFLPGITMEYAGGSAREVSINGVPGAYTPVTLDGFNLATAVTSGTSRVTAVDMVSINSLSRIEVSYSPTPESAGSALAGSVNMVPRSSFDRARPVFNGSAYVMLRDQLRTLHPTASPREGYSYKVYPGFDFSWVVPINQRFGFTLSGGSSRQYAGQDFTQNTWRGIVVATNGGTFPHTTPDRPYLSTYLVRDGGKETTRNSLAATFDYRLSPTDRLSLSLQLSSFEELVNQRSLTFNVNRVLPGDFSPTRTRGATAAGNVQQSHSGSENLNRTYMPTLTWRHAGALWKAEAGLGLSHAQFRFHDIDRGFFQGVNTQRTGVTVSFDEIFYLRPRVIAVTDGATGLPVDPYKLGTFALQSAASNRGGSVDSQRTAFANLARDFGGRFPLVLKAGLDMRESARDLRGGLVTYNYVGRDGRASTVPADSDDSAAPFLAPEFSERPAPFGFPIMEWASRRKLLGHFESNPTYFVVDRSTEYRNAVTRSKYARELITAAYLRGDVALLQRRLKLVGGLRAEQTNIAADGPLTDATLNYQRDAAGRVILGTTGRPLTIVPATDALGVSQRTYLDRGSHTTKEYLRLFPSLNASYELRENLILRAATYASVGRPDFNQYAGGLTLPDADSPPANNNRITVNNAGIKAWSARTVNLRLEYYFTGVGQISVGAFQRKIRDFFGSTIFRATPEFLALYGLPPSLYEPYDVSTQYNLPGTVRLTGIDLSYKQAITFLPAWARGLQIFANASAQRVEGDTLDNFAGYIPRNGSWGISLTREKYNARINWNYRGRQRRGVVASGASIEPGTYNWGAKRLYTDVSGEYNLSRRLALFANLRNIGDTTEDMEVAGPSTPPHAQFRQRLDFGSLWTFGLKGTF